MIELAASAGLGYDPDTHRTVVRAPEGPIEELGREAEKEPFSAFGPSAVRKEVRVLPGVPGREGLAGLLRVLEEEVGEQGMVTEALDSVRWTNHGVFRSTQVSVEPQGGETAIRVEDRYSDAVRGPLHGVPAVWGLIFGLALGLEGLSLVLPVALVIAAVFGVLGWGAGDLAWRAVASTSAPRVKRLADRLYEEGTRLAQGEGTGAERPALPGNPAPSEDASG